MTKIVHVVGTGTIGEPLIGLLAGPAARAVASPRRVGVSVEQGQAARPDGLVAV